MAHCGAKKRSNGEPCKRHAVPGSSRCKLHGGAATKANKGNQHARKHGIYSDTLTVDEQGLWDDIGIGTLDDDIKIAKLQLRRALLAQAKAEAGDGLDLDLESINIRGTDPVEEGEAPQEPGQPTTTTQRRRRGYEDIINRLLGRIGDLESKRADMMKKLDPDDEGPLPQRIEVVVTDARRPNAEP
ncbi:hypothetical protein GIB64_02315 [Pseudomonas lactis]|uniref:HGGxSTG domain-containing protein n=1 Tax=Pseudomonas TaxID=286 RepID=UPI000BB60D41|nr:MULTISPECIES: HGGxSTG domain-containing protein [Pseudomonas]MBA5956252.1 hypothetical protein [Pseudomonas lactis]PRW80102.1 hypothetical protein C7A12_02705 [Pseudomonas fluorescens]PRW80877.1 hypothetical protein C7A13_06580 [Pseudomonas fluorescens]